ncbi:hypothetical protein U1Q18_011456, partial [Sarracenia purpurea var. burkii]
EETEKGETEKKKTIEEEDAAGKEPTAHHSRPRPQPSITFTAGHRRCDVSYHRQPPHPT